MMNDQRQKPTAPGRQERSGEYNRGSTTVKTTAKTADKAANKTADRTADKAANKSTVKNARTNGRVYEKRRGINRKSSRRRNNSIRMRRMIITAVCGILFIGLLIAVLAIPPRLELNGDGSTEVEVFGKYSEEGARATFIFFDISDKIEYGEDPPFDITGSFEKEYTLHFKNHEYKISRKINVIDSVPPEITLNGEADMLLSSIDFYNEEGCTASDNYDGDITSLVTIDREYIESESSYVFTYTAKDSSENTTTVKRNVKVQDIVPPALNLIGDAEMTVTAPVFKDPGVSAVDDVDGDITASVKVDTDYKEKTLGKFSFVYSVKDSSGNESFASREITVKDTAPPEISLSGDKKMYIYKGESFSDPGASAYDDFDGDVTSDITVSNDVNTAVSGTYSVIYSAEDSNKNASSAKRTVIVRSPAVTLDVPFISQRGSYPNGCESVSAVMAMQYAGINISVDSFISNYLDMCELPAYDENGTRWGHTPWQYFIGDPRKSTGMCCYAPVIKKACDKCMSPSRVLELYDVPVSKLCEDYISNGVPVVIWATIQMKSPYKSSLRWNVIDSSGEVFRWTAPMHCVLLTGFDDSYYYFNDPLEGKNVKYSKAKVEAAYAGMYKQAIVIK